MQIEHLDIDGANLRAVLLRRLRERVFHVTSQENFEKIRRDGAVLHNRDERFPLNVASQKSFGRMRGWVCLFDLRGCDDRTLENTLEKYNFLEPRSFVHYEPEFTISELAYLFMKFNTYNDIAPNEVAQKECPHGHYIPRTEAWYRRDVPLSCVASVLLVTIRTEAPAGHDGVLHEIEYRDQQQKSGDL